MTVSDAKTYQTNTQMEHLPFHLRPYRPAQPERLPSRVSRRGLPCPEVWDTYVPRDESDLNGFIRMERKPRKRRHRRGEEE